MLDEFFQALFSDVSAAIAGVVLSAVAGWVAYVRSGNSGGNEKRRKRRTNRPRK